MKKHKIEAWVDDGLALNFMYPGADFTPALYVSIDGESIVAENYQTLFVDKLLGALADIPYLLDEKVSQEERLDIEDAVWEKVEAFEGELRLATECAREKL